MGIATHFKQPKKRKQNEKANRSLHSNRIRRK